MKSSVGSVVCHTSKICIFFNFLDFLTDQFNRISEATREALLVPKPKPVNKPGISLALKFNKTLPKIKEIIDKH